MLLLLGFKMITRKKWIQEYAKDGNTEPEKDKIELRWWSLLSFSRKTPTKYDAHFLFGDCSVHTTFIRDTPWESRQESVSLWGPCLESVCCTISCSNSCCFFPVVSWNLTFIFWAFFVYIIRLSAAMTDINVITHFLWTTVLVGVILFAWGSSKTMMESSQYLVC